MTSTTEQVRTIEQDTAERFVKDTAQHTLTVRHDDGLYRHLYCGKPGTGFWSFEIITWPGALAIRGDFSNNAYVFRRLDDMFEFFRSDKGQINAHYWSEKLAGGRDAVLEHSEDTARRRVMECLDEYEADGYRYLVERFNGQGIGARPTPPADVRQAVAEYEVDSYLSYADGTREVLRDLENLGVTADTWEWDLRDWDWSFLWACHAIVWAIRQYDVSTGRAAKVATVELDGVTR